MNICPTYGVVGGHTFGHIYPGPIGIPWTARVHGLELAGDFAPLCISCGLCKEICPADIDIPMMIAAVKDEDSETHTQPLVNRVMMAAEVSSKIGSATAPLSNWVLGSRTLRWLMEKTQGIDRRRELPRFARKTLRKRFEKRKKLEIESPRKKVVFFADLYANYNRPDLGMAAIEILEAAGCEVILPKQKASGYPYIGYGDLKRARKVADENLRLLLPYVDQGYDVVTTEPTAAYCLRKSYPTLLEYHEGSKKLADHTFEFFEFLESMEEEVDVSERALEGQRLGFHISCHQQPLGAGRHAMDALRRRGAEVEPIETGTCCGMGGTFGLKAGLLGYELSQAVGEPLFQMFTDAKVDAIVTESSVCAIQLKEGTGLEVYHPLDLLAQAAG